MYHHQIYVVLGDRIQETMTIRNKAVSQFAKEDLYSSELNQQVLWNPCILCNHTSRTTMDYMGYCVRGDNFRYTEWFRWDKTNMCRSGTSPRGLNCTTTLGTLAKILTCRPRLRPAHMPNLRLLQARFRAALLKQFQGDHVPPQRGPSNSRVSMPLPNV
jgi:hypothetical protein